MTKIGGSGSRSRSESGSGSISQRHGSADPVPDPDPSQNVMDPQHCFSDLLLYPPRYVLDPINYQVPNEEKAAMLKLNPQFEGKG
jgi:hypothetical protein